METNWVLPAALTFALLGVGSGAGSVCVDGTQMEGVQMTLRETYTVEVGVREATGSNDGPRIAEYLRYCGLDEGYEWCAAFVSWCHGQAGYPEPRNAWAAALFPAAKTINPVHVHPRAGDVFGTYVASKKRIGHCGFVDRWEGSWVVTVEGNVNNAVVRKRRLIKTIRAVSRWAE